MIRFAFELARRRAGSRDGGEVTVGVKSNVLPRSDGMFASIGKEVATEYPDVGHRTPLVDDLAHRLVTKPRRGDDNSVRPSHH